MSEFGSRISGRIKFDRDLAGLSFRMVATDRITGNPSTVLLSNDDVIALRDWLSSLDIKATVDA